VSTYHFDNKNKEKYCNNNTDEVALRAEVDVQNN